MINAQQDSKIAVI